MNFITLGMEAKILEDVSPLNKQNIEMLKLKCYLLL